MPQLWFERELEILLSLVLMLDKQLAELSDRSCEASDADAFGHFDTMEHLTGLAMVAAQSYIATACGATGLDKRTALAKGPRHRGGKSKAEIVNHAANYWKHNNEWGGEQSDRRRKAIADAFDSVGFPVGTDYPLSGVLTELCDPHFASLEVVADLVREWKSEVLAQ